MSDPVKHQKFKPDKFTGEQPPGLFRKDFKMGGQGVQAGKRSVTRLLRDGVRNRIQAEQVMSSYWANHFSWIISFNLHRIPT